VQEAEHTDVREKGDGRRERRRKEESDVKIMA